MAKVKRPSKSVIVNKALDFVFEAQVSYRFSSCARPTSPRKNRRRLSVHDFRF